MRSAAAVLQRLAADPRSVGARLGCLAVLHTWTRAMLYHPHVHLLVTAGVLSPDGTQWIAQKNPAFLVPVQALSVIFRAKVCEGLRRASLRWPPRSGPRRGSCTRNPPVVGNACSTISVGLVSGWTPEKCIGAHAGTPAYRNEDFEFPILRRGSAKPAGIAAATTIPR